MMNRSSIIDELASVVNLAAAGLIVNLQQPEKGNRHQHQRLSIH